jgi:hypothetical protein
MTKEKSITGYALASKLRKTRKRYPLTATEQALFYELIAICNEDGWRDTFNCSNQELCSALRISENSLVAARNTLIQCGLLCYKSGKSKRQFGFYSLENNLTTSNYEVNSSANAEVNTGTNACTNPEVNAADYNKHKVKHKLKPTSDSYESGTVENSDQPEKEKKERKKSSGQKKKEADTVPHWQPLVAAWFQFNETNLYIKPSFQGQDPKSLKAILDNLQRRALEKGFEWSEQKAVDTLNAFLSRAFTDQWLSGAFLLPNLQRQFDKIITDAKATKTGNAQSANAAHAADLARRMEEFARKGNGQPVPDTGQQNP